MNEYRAKKISFIMRGLAGLMHALDLRADKDTETLVLLLEDAVDRAEWPMVEIGLRDGANVLRDVAEALLNARRDVR